MRLGLHAMKGTLNFGPWGAGPAPNVRVVQRAEALGYHSVWTAEGAGTDAVTPLTWLAAHTTKIKLGTAVMQMTARPPAVTAATAATLDKLSGGRMLLGLGPSNPVVVEGWHNEAFGRSLVRSREYVDIIRKLLARNGAIDVKGEYYEMPYRGADGAGYGVGLQLMFRPLRRKIPIYLTGLGPKAVSLAYEIADGLMPAFYSPYREKEFFDGVDVGTRRTAIDIAPYVPAIIGDDVQACRDRFKPTFAVALAGMPGQKRTFYNTYIRRMGFEEFADKIHEAFSLGHSDKAVGLIPDDLVDEFCLCGPKERVRDRLEAWKESKVTTMILTGLDESTIETMAELVL